MKPMIKPLDLPGFLAACPTPIHTGARLAACLKDAGFTELQEGDSWKLETGRGYFVRRGQSGLAAFRMGEAPLEQEGVRIALAHTDSPGLKVKLLSQSPSHGVLKVGIEVYGSPILSTWFDRALSLAGQVITLNKGRMEIKEVDFRRPLGIIPSLALHYNRDINKSGFTPDPQNHLTVLLADAGPGNSSLEDLLGSELGIDPGTIVDQDLYFYPVEPPQELGGRLLVSGRIDNLTGCHQVLSALLGGNTGRRTQAAFFFEAEEVGSVTPGGAQSSFLSDVLTRMVLSRGGTEESVYRMKASSLMVSVDAAHGVHPNFTDRHDSHYAPVLGGGPVIKISAGARYATSGTTAALFEKYCRHAGVSCQRYIIRSDLPSGSTVGPVASALAGIPTVDVGIPMWAMHSSREVCHLEDHEGMILALGAFYRED